MSKFEKYLLEAKTITIEKSQGEYRVPSEDGYEDGAAYTDDKEDAIGIAKKVFGSDVIIKYRSVSEFVGGKYEKMRPKNESNDNWKKIYSKCPKCGSTDIKSLNMDTKVCNGCSNRWSFDKKNESLDQDVNTLTADALATKVMADRNSKLELSKHVKMSKGEPNDDYITKSAYQVISKFLRGTDYKVKQEIVQSASEKIINSLKIKESLLEEGFHYIIGMQKGKKYFVNTDDKWSKWDSELPNVKKFTKASAKQYTSYSGGFELGHKPMDEVVIQFKG